MKYHLLSILKELEIFVYSIAVVTFLMMYANSFKGPDFGHPKK